MNKVLSVHCICFVAAAVSMAAAHASVKNYRYRLNTRPPDTKYAVEVPAGARGRYFEVETDAQGRRVREAFVRNDKKERETIYHFTGSAMLPDRFDTYRLGKKTSYTEIQRNSTGDATRYDYYTADGTRTRYSLNSYKGNTVEQTWFDADGKAIDVLISHYGTNGLLTDDILFSNPNLRSLRVKSNYDQNSLETARRQFRDGKLTGRSKFIRNAEGDEIRRDVYNASGKRFLVEESADGLPTRKYYDSGQELRYAYDEAQRLKETKLYFKNNLICRFDYDRLSNGTVKRTLALGRDSTLWAEYKGQEIWDVDRQGHPYDGRPAVMHKTGNWW